MQQPLSTILRFALLLSLAASLTVNAPERCGTTSYEKMRSSQLKSRESPQQFEQWMKERIRQNQIKTFQTGKTQSATYVIPVIVHVIHNGEPVGTGTNISDA